MLPPPVRRSAGIGIARAHLATLVAATRVYRAGGLKRPAIGGLVNCHRNPVLISVLFAASGALAQGMLLDFAADKVVKKYQTATCDELKAQKGELPSEREKMAIEFLRNDSQARVAFIDKIAPTVMNKMFECGMIP